AVFRVQLDADTRTSEALGDEQCRATAEERVEDNALAGTVVALTGAGRLPAFSCPLPLHHSLPRRPALRTRLRRRTGQDTWLDEFLREHRKVGPRGWLYSDGPDGTLISRRIFIPNGWFPNRVGVIVIPRALGKQENVLVRLRRPIRHNLRHRVRLVPNYVGPQVPPIRLEEEGYPPRDSDKVFHFEDVVFGQSAVICWSIVASFTLPLFGRSCVPVAIPVAIAQIQPDCPVWSQHLANPAEHLDQLRDVLLRCRLYPDLLFNAVVPK